MISYGELRFCWLKGCRNGNVKKLAKMQRWHFRACLIYARRVGRIVNRFLVGQLRAAMDVLLSSPRRLALKHGGERARELLARFKHSGVFNWAPRVKRWLMDETFKIYLGFMSLNGPSRVPF